MLSTQELIEEALVLPIEERAFIIESLIRNMNPTDTEIDRKWIGISQKRLNDLKSGKVRGIPGDEVFNKIRTRFSQ